MPRSFDSCFVLALTAPNSLFPCPSGHFGRLSFPIEAHSCLGGAEHGGLVECTFRLNARSDCPPGRAIHLEKQGGPCRSRPRCSNAFPLYPGTQSPGRANRALYWNSVRFERRSRYEKFQTLLHPPNLECAYHRAAPSPSSLIYVPPSTEQRRPSIITRHYVFIVDARTKKRLTCKPRITGRSVSRNLELMLDRAVLP